MARKATANSKAKKVQKPSKQSRPKIKKAGRSAPNVSKKASSKEISLRYQMIHKNNQSLDEVDQLMNQINNVDQNFALEN